VPYLKKGVESWQVAFEAAGFRNAVIAKEAPSATEDPDWSPEDALKFLLDNAFKVPGWAINPEILRRIEPVGLLDRTEASQTRVLNSLLSSARVLRMVEQSAIDSTAAYDPLDCLTDVRRGI
jgi:hypothetical protein